MKRSTGSSRYMRDEYLRLFMKKQYTLCQKCDECQQSDPLPHPEAEETPKQDALSYKLDDIVKFIGSCNPVELETLRKVCEGMNKRHKHMKAKQRSADYNN
jgi:hypothetical protein